MRKGELDVGIAVLDGRVQAAQKVAVGARDFWHFKRVQDRLVVFIYQNGHWLSGTVMQCFDQIGETTRYCLGLDNHPGSAFDSGQLIQEVRLAGGQAL